MNRVNAMLSFLYIACLRTRFKRTLETIGLDSYVGFFHTDRPGRASLALDMIEELRAYMVDRLVLTMINRNQISKSDFEVKENDAVLLNEKRKRENINRMAKKETNRNYTSFIKETIPIGLIPYVQAQLLSRHIRGDLDEYPPFIS